MTNKSHTLYVGMTNDLFRRLKEHNEKSIKSFTNKYNINKLVYFEEFNDPMLAISAEKKVKGWNRKKKIEIIKKINPDFKDLLE